MCQFSSVIQVLTWPLTRASSSFVTASFEGMASSVFGALYRAFGSPVARRSPLLTGMERARIRRSEALLEISEQSVFVENYPPEDPANGPLCVAGVTAFVLFIGVFAGSGRRLVTGGRCFRRMVNSASTRFSARTALRTSPGHRGRDGPTAGESTDELSTDLRKHRPAGTASARGRDLHAGAGRLAARTVRAMLVVLLGGLFDVYVLQNDCLMGLVPVLTAVFGDEYIIGIVILLGYFVLLDKTMRRASRRRATRDRPTGRTVDKPSKHCNTDCSWRCDGTVRSIATVTPGVPSKLVKECRDGLSTVSPDGRPRGAALGASEGPSDASPTTPRRTSSMRSPTLTVSCSPLKALAMAAAASTAAGATCNEPLQNVNLWPGHLPATEDAHAQVYQSIEHRPLAAGAPQSCTTAVLSGPPGLVPEYSVDAATK